MNVFRGKRTFREFYDIVMQSSLSTGDLAGYFGYKGSFAVAHSSHDTEENIVLMKNLVCSTVHAANGGQSTVEPTKINAIAENYDGMDGDTLASDCGMRVAFSAPPGSGTGSAGADKALATVSKATEDGVKAWVVTVAVVGGLIGLCCVVGVVMLLRSGQRRKNSGYSSKGMGAPGRTWDLL